MRRQIFIVEDDYMMSNFISSRLSTNFEIRQYFNANDAYRAINANLVPDIIIVDLGLPGISGMDLIRQLKYNVGWSKIPIIVVSGSQSNLDVLEVLGLGVNCYLQKPFKSVQMEAVVDQIRLLTLLNT